MAHPSWTAWLAGLAVVAAAGMARAQDEPPKEPPPEAKPAEAPAPKREVKDGRLTDPYWGLAYEAEGLREGMGSLMGGMNRIFAGDCAGGVEVEILVNEGPKELSAAEWSKSARDAWTKQGRKMTEVEEPESKVPSILFVEESLSGFKRHHGYSFHARGLQGFVVHATVREKSETSGAAILARLGGLRLGEDAGGSLLAVALSKQAGRPPADLEVRLDAGIRYLDAQVGNPAMGLCVLTGVLQSAKEGSLDADATWLLHEYMGISNLMLKRFDAAIDCLKRSEALAPKAARQEARTGQSTYNLACGYSLSGKLDLAFETLARCARMGNWTTYWESAQSDPDLEPMRKDPRWPGLRTADKAPDAPKGE